MGGYGSGKGLRIGAWRSKKLKVTSLPGLKAPELVRLHKSDLSNSFRFKDIKISFSDIESPIYLEHMKGEKLLTAEIKLAAVPRNYGGFMYLWHCPICQKRVRTLYLNKTYFACRHCFGMCYHSQNQTLSHRFIDKLKNSGKKINNNEWVRPKWMRKKTFSRLRREYLDLDEKWQIADFFSLRNNRSANEILSKYGSAMTAAEVLGAEMLGI